MRADWAQTPQVLAVVAGQPVTELPCDLFIPPDALEVLLDSFTGPLDLLLYLIRQQNIDILNIPMLIITRQYMQYIELMETRRMELAADYLVMAALLIEIKSKMLLPVSVFAQDDIEEDPRMQLVRRLQIYEQFKQAAILVDGLTRSERDVFQVKVFTDSTLVKAEPDIGIESLVEVMGRLLQQQRHLIHHQITREALSVRERMSDILARLQHEAIIEFRTILTLHEGRMGLVVTFLAVLELAKQSLLLITQASLYGPIYLKAN